jgi:glycosyltransferase involved in cell wall biosynthesis
MIWAAGIDTVDPQFHAQLNRLLAETAGTVHFAGPYGQDELGGLLGSIDWVVVPSVWWETGPLVIHEARLHRRPVICSDIGSMLERVRDGVDGLHFHVGDPRSLAETIRRAVSTPGLWDELRAQITDPYPMDAHLERMTGIYRDLITSLDRPAVA